MLLKQKHGILTNRKVQGDNLRNTGPKLKKQRQKRYSAGIQVNIKRQMGT